MNQVQPKIYPQEEHGITLDQIDRHALYIIEKLRARGHIAYLVGGGVRDLLLGHTPKDYDISTSAKPEEIKALFGRQCILIGRRFRLAHIRFGRKVIEVATFRAGDPESDELITRDNLWGTPEEDVLRRDFTINGLFYDSFEQTVIDYVEGYPDIKSKQLRMIGEPYVRYRQDPVRMIRLLKFMARFHLEAEHDTRLALIECKSEIVKSSQARVLEELLRMLESGAAMRFFQLMTDYGVLQMLLPEIAEFLEHPDGNEVYSYLKEIDLIHQEREESLDRALPLCALMYPLLKLHIQTHFQDAEKVPHLGELQDVIAAKIRTAFHPFFRLPKRIAGKMMTALIGQLRITPLEGTKPKRIRIPSTDEFHLAIDFLHLRTRIDPELKNIYGEWKEAFDKSGQPTTDIPRKRRPRRRRKRKTNG